MTARNTSFSLLAGLGLAWAVTAAAQDAPVNDPALKGAIDIHSHLDPDGFGPGRNGRNMDVLDMAKLAKDAGMRGFVIKMHYDQSADDAYIVRKLYWTDGTTRASFAYPAESVRTPVHNANLLGAAFLCRLHSLHQDKELLDAALRVARYSAARQREDGAWEYGESPTQRWVDNFHTAYVLLSLSRIQKCLGGGEIDLKPALERGYRFWREAFFLADGWPKYYHDTLYPADAHAAATAIITLVELQEFDSEALPLAQTIAAWTIRNLRDNRGFFYYQRRRFYTVHTPFMRWTQAWMLYALARLLEVT